MDDINSILTTYPKLLPMVEDMRREGWTDKEIHSYLLYTEEVNPALEEKFAVDNMMRIADKVITRLKESN